MVLALADYVAAVVPVSAQRAGRSNADPQALRLAAAREWLGMGQVEEKK